MTHIDAMRLALNALEVANSCIDGYYIPKGKTHLPEVESAITALRQAIEQAQQAEQDWSMLEAMQGSLREHMARIKELESQLAQQAEPVAIKTMSKIGKAVGYWRADLVPPHISPDSHDITFLYAMPPQRQPLSRKEVLAIIDKHPAEKKTGLPMFYRDQVLDICRAIEQAHSIKATGGEA